MQVNGWDVVVEIEREPLLPHYAPRFRWGPFRFGSRITSRGGWDINMALTRDGREIGATVCMTDEYIAVHPKFNYTDDPVFTRVIDARALLDSQE